MTAKRYKVGVRAQTDILTNILVAGGVDVKSVPCSRYKVWKAGIEAVTEVAENVKSDFKKSLVGRNMIIYIDGKSVGEFSEGKKSVKKRVAIIAKSHEMSQEQVLAVPVTKSNSGPHQFQAVTPVLDSWGVKPHVLGFAFDTTGDNTGRHRGLIVRLEKWVGAPCWWVACPHHHYEIHIKKVARLLYGESTSPDETLYKNFQTNRNKILEQGID